jgi:hypothetical protein
MADRRVPTECLTESEANRVLELCREHGSEAGTRMLGLNTTLTLLKAALGEPIHRLSAQTIREHLGRLHASD